MKKFYENLTPAMERVRIHFRQPLTLTEKILFSHAVHLEKLNKKNVDEKNLNEQSKIVFLPDHLAMDDATAQIALLQFPLSGEKCSAISASVHCDHIVNAENGVEQDLIRAREESGEVVDFLRNASEKYGLGFWKPGSGIMHHQLFDHFGFPGGLCLITDTYGSHLGGLGMLAFEGNGLDVLDLMTGLTCKIELPRLIGVRLTGKLKGWASAKDLALKMIKLLTVSGAKGAVIEYFGEGAETISCSGKAILCSMGAEAGALSSIFQFDKSMEDFLVLTGRSDIAELANNMQEHLQADAVALANPEIYFDQYIEFDLSLVEPHIAGPFSSDKASSLSELSELTFHHGYPEKLSLAIIGFTNSSYEDLAKAALIARKALKHGLKAKVPLLISPGSEQIKSKLVREGLWQGLEDVGAIELACARGPCEGNWKRNDTPFGEKNSILTSYNRASLGLFDGNPGTHTFIASPEIVMALALAGSLNFNPAEDALLSPQGLPVRFDVPSITQQLAAAPLKNVEGYIPPTDEGTVIQIAIDPSSEKLQILEPFKPPLEKGFTDLRLLIKANGKCTTNQISPEGKWLKYRGHLGNISNNLFSLAPNEFRDEIGRGKNLLSSSIEPFAKVAKDYKKEDIGWIVIAHENYGEGPHSDHAALSIRSLGGRAVITQSIDPMHELTLKKQGILVLTFAWPENGDKVKEDDLIDVLGVHELAVDKPLELLLKHADGTTERLKLDHSYTEEQIAWFKAGSFLGYLSHT